MIRFLGLALASALTLSASHLWAAHTEDFPKPVENYLVEISPANIAPLNSGAKPGTVEVVGQPRMAKGHPCTLWDQEDIDRLKTLLKSCKALQDEFAKLKDDMDKRIAAPLGIPDAKKGPDGEWMTLAAMSPGGGDVYKEASSNVHDISDLGTLYALTGEAAYGEFCKRMLLAYARNYPHYGHPDFRGKKWSEAIYRSAIDGRLTGQFLADGQWLLRAARGYDLVYNLPSWTDEERKLVREGLFEAITAEFVSDQLKQSYLDATHNRSAICTAGVLIAGYASDDQKLIDWALYGKGGTREKPLGGVLGVHFSERCISPDGLWDEGSMGYQNMATGGLIDDAETLWHHGIDLYRFRNCALKSLFDGMLSYAYPDMTEPATHDSHRASLFAEGSTDCHHTFEYAYLRYQDPAYLTVINTGTPHLRLSTHAGPTSVLFDLDRLGAKPAPPGNSVNFYTVGYGVLRLPAAHGIAMLQMEYGVSESHGHPSKLGLDLFAMGDVIMPDPGVIFPYDAPLDNSWYKTTLGHNALSVDEKSQIFIGNRFHFPKNWPEPEARQVVFGPAQTCGIQRASSSTTYPGVMQDRAIFFTPEYVADLFAAFSDTSHTYDLAWHLRGSLATELKFEPMKFPADQADGYGALLDVKHTTTDKAWTASTSVKDRFTRLVAAGGIETGIITGIGFYRVDQEHLNEKTPAIIERRSAKSALFANAVDISGNKDGYVKSVVQDGGLDAGYGLLKIETLKGTDVCFAAYRPGTYQAGGLETDAQQAFVQMDGPAPCALYLAGGKSLKAGEAIVQRSEPGLAYVEKLPNGTYIVGNPSPTDATVTVTLPGVTDSNPFTARISARTSVPLLPAH